MISTQTAQVFYAPTACRRFLTLRGACCAEAAARIRAKYPNERGSEDYPGWHWWCDLPKAAELHRRYARLIMREYRKARKP